MPEPTPKPGTGLSAWLDSLKIGETSAPEAEDGDTQDALPDDDHDEYRDDNYDDGDVAAPGTPFDVNVRDITGRAFGNAVECATLTTGWTVARGYYLDDYRITGQPTDAYNRQVLADAALVFSFIPAGAGIIYYGEATKGMDSWLFKYPGDAAPYVLSLTDKDSVFYADENHIWYYTYGSGSDRLISRMGYDGSNREQVGKLGGTIIAIMDDGSILAAFYSRNQVILWKDGKSTVVYESDKEIHNVISTGRSIWVQHEKEFGLLTDGALSFILPGVIRSMGRSSDQMVFVVESNEGAERYDVLMFNDVYGAWARVGDIKAQVNINVELMPPLWFIVWGPEESLEFVTPEEDKWLPYGHLDPVSENSAGLRQAPEDTGDKNAPAREDVVDRRIPQGLMPALGERELVELEGPPMDDAMWSQLLLGSWGAHPSVGSAYGERWLFTEDALYILPNQYDEESSGEPTILMWCVTDGRLWIGPADCAEPLDLEGPYQTWEDESPYSPKVFIGGKVFYQYSPDPAYFPDLSDYGLEIESSVGSPKAY